MGRIILQDIEFYSYHGCHKEEQEKGGHYLVDIIADLNLDKAAELDDISKVLDYQDFYRIAKEEMDKRAFLIENVCQRIVDRIFNELSEVKKVKVKVSKLNPPMAGKMKSVSVTLSRKRKNEKEM